MSNYYDDNFGHWNMEEEGMEEFYRAVQRTNVKKKCSMCGSTVMLQPHYDKCNSCCNKLELGYGSW
jgi:hypothetical protein